MTNENNKQNLIEENKKGNSMNKKLTTKQESYLKINLKAACYLAAIGTIGFASPAYADWFNLANVKTNLIKPTYEFVDDVLGYIAFAIGGIATFFARGMDMWQKACAFGVGGLGTAAAVKLVGSVLHLGPAQQAAAETVLYLV